MRKKIVLIVTALIMALSVCSLVACKNENEGAGDETAKVIAVSAAEYKTADEAVRGYVENELAVYDGEDPMLTAEFVSKESKGDADSEKLGLTEADKKDLAKAELFVVTAKIKFAVDEETFAAAAPEAEQPETVTANMKMYVLKYGESKFAYAVPEAKIGERVTNSEINKAFNSDTHSNCTETEIDEELGKDGATWVFDSASVTQYTATEQMYVSYHDKTRFEAGTPNYTENASDYYRYEVTEGAKTYGTRSGSSDVSELSKTVAESLKTYISQYTTGVMGFYPGAKGLVKTATGAKAAITFLDGLDCEGECSVTITDGKLTQIMFWAIAESEQGGKPVKMGMKMTVKYEKFGSTAITGATEAKEKVAAYKAQHAE